MTNPDPDRFERLRERYRAWDLPWDRELPPPEVQDIAGRLTPGRMLDLGAGSGRAAIYMAARGWEVDAVDFVPEAVALAQDRVRAAGVGDRVRLHRASVAELDFLTGPYDLALDVGCVHGMDPAELPAYAAGLARLVRPGGVYLLFAHLRQDPEQRGIGLLEGAAERLFAGAFEIVAAERGETTVAGATSASAWYTMRRR